MTRAYYKNNGVAVPAVVPATVSGCSHTHSISMATFVAVVARLNAARMTAGKAPLGFLNPFLYQLRGEGFTDITTVSTTAAPLN